VTPDMRGDTELGLQAYLQTVQMKIPGANTWDFCFQSNHLKSFTARIHWFLRVVLEL